MSKWILPLFLVPAVLFFSAPAARAQSAGLDLILLTAGADSVVIRAKMYNPPGVSYRLQAVYVAMTYEPSKFTNTRERGVMNHLFSTQNWDMDSNPRLDTNGVYPDISLYGESCPNFCSLQINQNAILNLCTFTFFPLSAQQGTASFCVIGNKPTGAMTGYYITTSIQNQPFDPVSCLDNITYPVELASLSAAQQAESVILKWTTATETNNYGFTVERRFAEAENDAWTPLEFVHGRGTSLEEAQYLFIDKTIPSDGWYEYRLAQQDFDGTVARSRSVRVEFRAGAADFSLEQWYPNPVAAASGAPAVLRYSIPERSRVTLVVRNALGIEVAELMDYTLDAGSYTAQWNPLSLPPGMYVASLTAVAESSGAILHASRKIALIR